MAGWTDESARADRYDQFNTVNGTTRTEIARLNSLANEYGMQLPTIADRLGERFIRPLVIDRLRAMVEPAMDSGDARRA